jgi:hypothetical protein
MPGPYVMGESMKQVPVEETVGIGAALDRAMRIKARIEKAIGGPLEEILSSSKPNELNEPNKFCEA